VSACEDEHALAKTGRKPLDPQWIRKVELVDESSDRSVSLPLMCQHCEDPPCVDVCPTGASFRRADGIVLVDKHTCIGCRYCMMACPFNARSFVHEDVTGQKSYSPRGKGTVESCTLCVHRVDQDRTPACVESCAVDGGGALAFGDLSDAESTVSKTVRSQPHRGLRPDLELNTGVRYRGV
jgi:molybdopterin-containing oxidoreductase family iron-sulfur binding subunit